MLPLLLTATLSGWDWYSRNATVPTCPTGNYFDSRILNCVECTGNTEPHSGGVHCICKAGYAGDGCLVDCVGDFGLASDSNRFNCSSCDGTTTTLNITSRECQCDNSNGNFLVDHVSDSQQQIKSCLSCENGIVINGLCVGCYLSESFEMSSDCSCPSNTTQVSGVCLPTRNIAAVPGASVTYPDIGSTIRSDFLATEAVKAATKCNAGWTGPGGCQYLTNLCVLQLYDLDQGACELYFDHLTNRDGGTGCRTPCEVPTDLPWLFYQRTERAVLQESLDKTVRFDESLDFVITAYDLVGNRIGTETLNNQIFICEVREPVAEHGLRFGNNIIQDCELNTKFLSYGASEPLFYELFIRDRLGNLKPVPIRVNADGDDESLFYTTDSIRNTNANGISMYRRFMLYDNVLSDQYVRYASELTLLFALEESKDERAWLPVVTIDYETIVRLEKPAAVQRNVGNNNVFMNLADGTPRTVLSGDDGVKSSVRIFYTSNLSRNVLISLLITASCVGCATSLIKTWAWQRRLAQDRYFNPFALLVRLFVYYCSHISGFLFIILAGASIWHFLWFKGQQTSSVLVPPPGHINNLYTALLWTSFSTRCVDIAYRVYEQCSMWVFLLDWEQPRGKLLSENKDLPVSMWRMVFVANEFNELQALLSSTVYLNTVLVVFLLEAAGLQGLTTAQPNGNNLSLDGSYSHPLLRMALTIMLWYGCMSLLWIWDHLIYYRFLAANPVREFIDLCSLANVSVFLLPEKRYGYYIHGKSVHQFSDASVREFQAMLQREEEGAIPMRGLTGPNTAQTFEIVTDDELSEFLWKTQAQLARERFVPSQATNRPRRCYEYVLGRSSRNVLTQEALRHLQELNRRLQSAVTRVGDETLLKTPIHRSLGVIPFSFAGMPTRFFIDNDSTWTNCILLSLEISLSNLALLSYLAVDFTFSNSIVAACVAFIVVYFVQVVRSIFGNTNLGNKTMIDDRFFL